MDILTSARVLMEFSGKLTAEDWKDAGAMTRSKLYWPRVVLANWYGLAAIGTLVWATIAGLLGQTQPVWTAMAIIWTVIIAIIGWSAFRVTAERAREIVRINDMRPDTIRFTSAGIAFDGPDGAVSFRPWWHFNGWREGRRVVILDRPHVQSAAIVSIASLSEMQRERVRDFLGANIAAQRKP